MPSSSWPRFAWLEFCVVIGVSLGWAVVGSLSGVVEAYLASPISAGAPAPQVAEYNLHWLTQVILTELVAFVPFVLILRWRGWRFAEFPMRITPKAALASIGIAVAAMIGMAVVVTLLQMLVPENPAFESVGKGAMPGLLVILILSVVNGAFEEIVLLGYIIRFFERLGLGNWSTVGIAVSAIIRASYHTYQGPVAAVAIGLLGATFAWLYVRNRNLLIFAWAHMLLDFLALLPQSQG